MNNTDGSRSYLQIAPSNQTARISYKSGNPVVNFVVGEQNRFLDGYSVRMTGNIAIYKTANGDFGDIPVPADDLNISSKLGVYGMIDQVVITSQKYKSVIEHCKHFGRYLASYIPARTSQSESLTNYMNNTGMVCNTKAQKLALVNNTNGSSATNRVTRGTAFSIDLPTGFLNSGVPISLAGNGGGVGGLEIAIHLAPDSQFLNGSYTNAFYQLTNVNLICEVINPSVDQLSQMMKQTSNSIEYNAITGYYQTIQSSDAILNLRLGLSRVLGLFVNFIPSEYLNNLTYDSYQCSPLINDKATGEIAPIKQVVFLKGGNRLPLMYNLDTNVRDNLNSEIADPQLFRNYMTAFGHFMNMVRTQQSPITNNRISQVSQTTYADSGQMFGVGISFDSISSEGVDFRNENLSVQMETGLTSGLAHSAFMFVRAKQTLLMTPNGLQVIN